ncbi:MAG: phosphoribosylformylglycinamidine synthase, partial [Proteobacteria bacterium]
MHAYFFSCENLVYLVEANHPIDSESLAKISWLTQAPYFQGSMVSGAFLGPRREMITPWSSNACDILSNMGISGVLRMEYFERISDPNHSKHDPMLQAVYNDLDNSTLHVDGAAQASFEVENLREFNREAALALSDEEISFLEDAQRELGRRLTDAEVFAFGQINSEHCRHKIFNGSFIIDGEEKPRSLFAMIKETSKRAPARIVSAYSDNVAFVRGCGIVQFYPADAAKPDYFGVVARDAVISLKAETHNFPTAVEPFNGASTGSGGEIRDRMAGGLGGVPLAGTAVYMTALPRLEGSFASKVPVPKERVWKYQSPQQILIKASIGASDFGNKFGQPLICGSLLTYEGETSLGLYGYDRCVMLAGGVGYALSDQAHKRQTEIGDCLVVLGGDNYRIGLAGGSVSSVDTGRVSSEVELSAVQRANPEMQKRAYNAIRSLIEASENPIKIIHDHGAGGHVNCFSELLEKTGGRVKIAALPIGDKTLSVREILCNESQERMGLVISPKDMPLLRRIAARERCPLYEVGEIDGSGVIAFEAQGGSTPFALPAKLLFGASPRTVMNDTTTPLEEPDVTTNFRSGNELLAALKLVLSSESVACKDWLTNKVDRCVTGLVAQQQCVGPLQLPLSNVGIAALDYASGRGVATALGHAPIAGLADARAGSILSVAEALTNIVWAPLDGGLEAVALSANWMWPAKQNGEDARLYAAVEALSNFAIALGIPVPTGKDSLSMTMRYSDGLKVKSPGTVIVTAAATSINFTRCVTPEIKPNPTSRIFYLDLSGDPSSPLGGSIYAQSLGKVGAIPPTVKDTKKFAAAFNAIQDLIKSGAILAGHDVSSGGVRTTLCEMAFAGDSGIKIWLSENNQEVGDFLFCEKPGVVLQVAAESIGKVKAEFSRIGAALIDLGAPQEGKVIELAAGTLSFKEPLGTLRDIWFSPSYLLDSLQTNPEKAKERFQSYSKTPLSYKFPAGFTGRAADYRMDFRRTKASGLKAAVIREQGSNGEREMAHAMFLAGFDVRDVVMSDLIEGRETLEDLSFIAFPGGFANSDVFGAGRGWAAAFRFNPKAYQALQRFMQRPDTLSLGVCNGCQLMV